MNEWFNRVNMVLFANGTFPNYFVLLALFGVVEPPFSLSRTIQCYTSTIYSLDSLVNTYIYIKWYVDLEELTRVG